MNKGEFWKEIEEAEEFVEEFVEEEIRVAVDEKREGWKREGKFFIWKERIYMPDSVTLCEEILQRHHNHELAGHPGYTKMHKFITQNYW